MDRDDQVYQNPRFGSRFATKFRAALILDHMAPTEQRFSVHDTQIVVRQFIEAVIREAYRVPGRKPSNFARDLAQRWSGTLFQN